MNESTILAILKASFDRVIGPRGLFQSTVLICEQTERTFKNGQGTMHIRDGSKLYTRATVEGGEERVSTNLTSTSNSRRTPERYMPQF